MKSYQKKSGFTITEILVSVGILVFIGLAIASFSGDIFFLNNSLQSNLSVQIDARRVLRTMVSELRGASPSSLGAYPLSQVGTSSLIFYSNIDSDSYKERVRYFLQGDKLMRGILKPSGSPLSYNVANESMEVLINDVVNSSTTPIFQYFDNSYSGTSLPLADPVNILSVRLVQVTVLIDHDTGRDPGPISVTSMGTLRNLKDNL